MIRFPETEREAELMKQERETADRIVEHYEAKLKSRYQYEDTLLDEIRKRDRTIDKMLFGFAALTVIWIIVYIFK